MLKIRAGRFSGKMTAGARKRLAKSICLLVQASKPKWITNTVSGKMQYHKLSFITLTIACPRNITAKVGYDLILCHFLDWLTRTKGVKMNVWKAELQERGQLHYHLTVPDFIDYREIRKKWNSLQREAGLLTEYFAQHGHYDPNSTDIKDVRNVRNIEAYLIKELVKTIDAKRLKIKRVVEDMITRGEVPADQLNAKVDEILEIEMSTEGRIWGCSQNLSKGRYFNMVLENRHDKKIDQWIKEKKIREVRGDFFTILYFDDCDPGDLFNKKEREIFEEHIQAIAC